jgi:FecR-like protein
MRWTQIRGQVPLARLERTVSAWRAIKTLAIAGLVVGPPGYAQAQGQPGVGVVTALVGEATVTRAAMAQAQTLKKRDDVFPQDRISTRENSLVHVLMGGKALLTVRELSVLTVTEEAGRATVNLQSGKVGLAVVRERMRPGEVIEVQTPHALAAVRGTVLVVEIVPDSSDGGRLGTSTNVHLLHGKLDVSLRSDPGAPPVQLETLQSVTVSGNGLGAVRPLSPAAATAVTANLRTDQPTPTALPGKFQSALVQQQQALAVATVDGVLGGRPSRKGQGAQARAQGNGRATESGSDRDAIDVVSDATDGIGEGGVSASGSSSDDGNRGGKGGGSGDGDRNGNGRGKGLASGTGGGNGQSFGSGSGAGNSGLGPVVTNFLKKGKK